MPELTKTVYTPLSPLQHPLQLVGEILRDCWSSRDLISTLFMRDLKAQFRQSFLGYAWLIIPPLANAGVWYLLNSQRLINVETTVPYPVFVLVGSMLWVAFSATLLAPSDVIFQNREVFVKLNVPVEAFILAGTARAVFNLFVTLVIILPLLLLQSVSFGWSALLFPLAAVTVLLPAFSLGMLLAPIGALYTDFRNAITPLLGLMMFTLPIVFPVPSEPGIIGDIIRCNPLTPAFALSRDVLLSGDFHWMIPALLCSAVSMVLLLMTFIGLRVAKPHIIARLGM